MPDSTRIKGGIKMIRKENILFEIPIDSESMAFLESIRPNHIKSVKRPETKPNTSKKPSEPKADKNLRLHEV